MTDTLTKTTAPPPDIRHDWTAAEAGALLALPFNDLLFRAQTVHRANFDPNRVQISTLLSIKTGGCPEDCAYCPQSARHETEVEAEPLMVVDEVLAAAQRAKEAGASRFCMGAAWRAPKDRDLDDVIGMVEGVKAGLDYYNHNLDTSPEFYSEIISTRCYDDRLDTLAHVRDAGINVCAGGIVGMGEDRGDRARLLVTLANLPKHPESVPVNMLVRAPGTPLAGADALDPLEFVRTIAVARIMMPRSVVRLSAGRLEMDAGIQALAFHAGANSIFLGDTLLTTDNPLPDADRALFERLGIEPAEADGTHSPRG